MRAITVSQAAPDGTVVADPKPGWFHFFTGGGPAPLLAVVEDEEGFVEEVQVDRIKFTNPGGVKQGVKNI